MSDIAAFSTKRGAGHKAIPAARVARGLDLDVQAQEQNRRDEQEGRYPGRRGPAAERAICRARERGPFMLVGLYY